MSARDDYPYEGADPMRVRRQRNRMRAEIDRLRERNRLLHEVAHRAWHLMDDSGEMEDASDYLHDAIDHQRVSDALDALEEDGWTPHDD